MVKVGLGENRGAAGSVSDFLEFRVADSRGFHVQGGMSSKLSKIFQNLLTTLIFNAKDCQLVPRL